MSIDINKHETDIDNLKKQNVNDLSSIKELYRKLKEVEEKISQIKYIDSTLSKKLQKDYEKLKKIILDENEQSKLAVEIETINSQLDNVNSQLENVNSQMNIIINNIGLYSSKETSLLINLIRKINDNTPLKIICKGDSLTAGGQEGTTITYPSVLQSILRDYNPETIVINNGVGGDSTLMSLNRMTTNPEADLFIVQLCTNDFSKGLTINESFNNIIKICIKCLEWETPVILLSPPRKQQFSTSIAEYQSMIKKISALLNIPTFDSSEALEGYSMIDTFLSDQVHLTDTGYYALGSFVSNLFIGETIINCDDIKILSNKHLTIDGWRKNLRFSNGIILKDRLGTSKSSLLGVGYSGSSGSCVDIKGGEQLNISFYSLQDSLVLFPIFENKDSGKCEIYLNYRAKPRKQLSKLINPDFNYDNDNNNSKSLILDSGFQSLELTSWCNLVVTKRGLNQVYVKNNSTTDSTIKFMGFYVIDYETFKLKKELDNKTEQINELQSYCVQVAHGKVTSESTTGRVEFSKNFKVTPGVSAIVEEYGKTEGRVSIYNLTPTGFEWNVNTVGVTFRWLATGY